MLQTSLHRARLFSRHMTSRRSARIAAGADPAKAAVKGNQTESVSTSTSKRKIKPSKENGITKKAKTAPTRKTTAKAKEASNKDPAASASNEFWSTPALQTPKRNVTSVADSDLRLTPPPQPRLDRPVDPHRTNATLVTPRGSSIVAYPSAEDASPSKTGLPRPIATTGNLLEQATQHLISIDPRLKPVIEQNHCRLFSSEGLAETVEPFESLASSIIGQQVSGAAARSIKNKFVDLFSDKNNKVTAANEEPSASTTMSPPKKIRFPTPAQVLELDIPTLRTAGLSQRKAEYIHGLAEKFSNGELSTQKLLRATDDEVMEMLIAVRGLGRWSVEMFSCFALKRTDVFSTGDLGVQRGCAAFVGKDISKLKAKGGGKFKYMSESDMLELAEKFRPYRSLFMWYMWRVEDVDVTVMNGT